MLGTNFWPICLKEDNAQNLPPIFSGDIESPSKNLNEQKKTHQKILIFDEVMAHQSSPFFVPLKNDMIWRFDDMTSLEHKVENE